VTNLQAIQMRVKSLSQILGDADCNDFCPITFWPTAFFALSHSLHRSRNNSAYRGVIEALTSATQEAFSL